VLGSRERGERGCTGTKEDERDGGDECGWRCHAFLPTWKKMRLALKPSMMPNAVWEGWVRVTQGERGGRTCMHLPTHDETSTNVGEYIFGRKDGGGGCLGTEVADLFKSVTIRRGWW